jgi:hypothetical protein
MNQEERKLMAELDDAVLGASDEDLKKLQELDIASQLKGVPFYDVYVNSKGMATAIKEKTQSKENTI